MVAISRTLDSTQQPTPAGRFLREAVVAEMLGISPKTLRKWRYRGFGPRASRLGAAIRYDREVLEAWIQSRPKTGGED